MIFLNLSYRNRHVIFFVGIQLYIIVLIKRGKTSVVWEKKSTDTVYHQGEVLSVGKPTTKSKIYFYCCSGSRVSSRWSSSTVLHWLSSLLLAKCPENVNYLYSRGCVFRGCHNTYPYYCLSRNNWDFDPTKEDLSSNVVRQYCRIAILEGLRSSCRLPPFTNTRISSYEETRYLEISFFTSVCRHLPKKDPPFTSTLENGQSNYKNLLLC